MVYPRVRWDDEEREEVKRECMRKALQLAMTSTHHAVK